jgi:hypothetical protein
MWIDVWDSMSRISMPPNAYTLCMCFSAHFDFAHCVGRLPHLQGFTYKAEDFRICVARALQRPADVLRGLVVDVEYSPESSSASAVSHLEVKPSMRAEG